MRPPSVLPWLASLVLALAACGEVVAPGADVPAGPDGPAADVALPADALARTDVSTSADAAARSDVPTRPRPVVHLGIMVHLEGWRFGNEMIFEDYAAQLRGYAEQFETHGAKLTLECHADHADAIERYGDNYLSEMEARGHAIGVHADLGFPEEETDLARFGRDLGLRKRQLEGLGVTVRHVSGICSGLDWLSAAEAAGFPLVSGNVAYCAMSLDPSLQPPEYSDCASPAACHEQYPVAAPHHPYRPRGSAFWTEPTRDGPIVLLPSGYILDAFAEERGGEAFTLSEAVFDEADVAAFEAELDAAVAAADPDRYNLYYVAWSFGKKLDSGVLEAWLAAVDERVVAGDVDWRTLPEMYDEFLAGEAASRR